MKRKKSGSKNNRCEIIQVRVDPILRFAAEIGAVEQKRSTSSFFEFCATEYLNIAKFQDVTVLEFAYSIWDRDVIVRTLNLAQAAPNLLNSEQILVWRIIKNEPLFWCNNKPNIVLIRLMWEDIIAVTEYDGKAFSKLLVTKVIESEAITKASEERAVKIAEFEQLWDELHVDEDAVPQCDIRAKL